MTGNEYTGGAGLPANAPIYIEHSNEVWNYGFGQYIWNKLAATDECSGTPPTCPWANDGVKDPEIWAQRRHIARTAQIGQVFTHVFGPGSFGTRVRPIWADVWSFPAHNMSATLQWFTKTYGPPANYFYGMATAGYYGGNNVVANMTLDEIYGQYKRDSDTLKPARVAMVQLAAAYGLKMTAYEAGPGWDVGKMDSVGNFIIAQRLAPMRDVYRYDLESSWIPAGGDLYNQFSLLGSYSRFGMWGAAEHFFNTSTPKYCGALDVIGGPLPPGCQGW